MFDELIDWARNGGGERFPGWLEAAKQAIKEYIVSREDSYRVKKSDVKKRWGIGWKSEDHPFRIQVTNVKGGLQAATAVKERQRGQGRARLR